MSASEKDLPLFPGIPVSQVRRTAKICRMASWEDDANRDADSAREAREETARLGWSRDFETWSHAARILECEADNVEALEVERES